MPGRTGKRAKPAGDCTICGKAIAGDFMRIGAGDDRHTDCQYPAGPNGPNAGYKVGRPDLEAIGRIRRAADDPHSGYDPDCPACLRGRTHTAQEHEEGLARARGVDLGADGYSSGPIDGDLGFDGSDEVDYPGSDVDDGGVEDVEIDRLPGDEQERG